MRTWPVKRRALLLLGCGALLAACGRGSADALDQPLLVAAASDLQPAFTELGERYTEQTGTPVAFSFGSSGQLAQQIVEGAPYDVFAAANVAFVDAVVDAGRADATTQTTYAYGRIAIWSSVTAWGGWTDLHALVDDAAVDTIAIANPEHAPYGAAAREALEATGRLGDAQDRLVYGENVSDTQRLAATGNADAAVVALSLALAADERGEGAWVLIDDDLHAPLQQDLVVTAAEPSRTLAATRFLDLVDSAEGREVMRRFGFLLPGEGPAGGR